MRQSVLIVVTLVVALAAAVPPTAQPQASRTATDFRCEVVPPPEGVIGLPFPNSSGAGGASVAACDGTCVIDVAFSYYPEAIDGKCQYTSWDRPEVIQDCEPGEDFSRRANSAAELRAYLVGALALVNGAYQDSGVDVEFRLARLERMRGVHDRPLGADLWYALDPMGRSFAGDPDWPAVWSGVAALPSRNSITGDPEWQSITGNPGGLDGAVRLLGNVYYEASRAGAQGDRRSYLPWGLRGWPFVIAHEFGHSLGLHHGPDARDVPGVSEWVGGNGLRSRYKPHHYREGDHLGWYGTIMSTGNSAFDRFSSATDTLYGRRIGSSTADGVTVLRRNAPHLAARAASRVPAPIDYGCEPGLCIDRAGRFSVGVRYEDPNGFGFDGSRLPAPIGANAALFYFFDPNNPEMLLKVLDGCSINGHWWVYGSAATDLSYTILLRDLAGTVQPPAEYEYLEYQHTDGMIVASRVLHVPDGTGFHDEVRETTGFLGRGVINDTRAFRCLP